MDGHGIGESEFHVRCWRTYSSTGTVPGQAAMRKVAKQAAWRSPDFEEKVKRVFKLFSVFNM